MRFRRLRHRSGRWRLLAVLISVAALLALAVPFSAASLDGNASRAAGPATVDYPDPPGDAGAAPDIVDVTVADDGAGGLTFTVHLSNRPGGLSPNDTIQIWLDTDANPATGASIRGPGGPTGFEWVLGTGHPVAAPYQACTRFKFVPPNMMFPQSGGLSCSQAPNSFAFSVNRANIGNPANFLFEIDTGVTSSPAPFPASAADRSPDCGTWAFPSSAPPVAVNCASSAPGVPTGSATGAVLLNGVSFSTGPVPFGSTVDVTNGRLLLQTPEGSLLVYGAGVTAKFVLLRLRVSGKFVDELRMVGGDFSVCKTRVFSAAGKGPPPKTPRRLFAKGKGSFRTKGRYSATTIRGTFWLTADRCDGTLTKTFQGVVSVRDLVRRKTVRVPAGKSYLARS